MNPQNGQTPLDYLNQIAPESQKKPLFAFNLRTIILGALVAVIIIIIIAVVSGAASNSRKDPWQTFAVRLAVTGTIVDSSSSKIKNSQLRSLNSDVKLYITNTQRDIATPLSRLDINPEKLPEAIIAREKGTGMAERLEDGRLNAKYDSTYAREMTYQLATMLALLQQLYSSSSNPEVKEMLETAYNNLKPIYDSISNFSASNE